MSIGEEAKSKRYVLRRLLKVAERTDSGRLFQREGPCVGVGPDPRDGQSDSSV